jgi:hypothetical protein
MISFWQGDSSKGRLAQSQAAHSRSSDPGRELGDVVVIEAFDDTAALWRARAQLRELLGDSSDGRRGERHQEKRSDGVS